MISVKCSRFSFYTLIKPLKPFRTLFSCQVNSITADGLKRAMQRFIRFVSKLWIFSLIRKAKKAHTKKGTRQIRKAWNIRTHCFHKEKNWAQYKYSCSPCRSDSFGDSARAIIGIFSSSSHFWYVLIDLWFPIL